MTIAGVSDLGERSQQDDVGLIAPLAG